MGNGSESVAAVVIDADVAFFDVDVGRAVFAHGAQLHQMAVGLELAQREEQVQRPDQVVDLGEGGVLAVDHGIRRRPLLGEMDDGVGLEVANVGRKESEVGHVAHKKVDDVAGKIFPDLQTIAQRANGRQGLDAEITVPLPADKAVHNGDLMSLLGQIQSGCPPAITISP